MSQNKNNSQENTPKSFLKMATNVYNSQNEVLDYIKQNKYFPSTDKTEYDEELKMMIHIFYKSLMMVKYCYVFFDRLDFSKDHPDFDMAGSLSELSLNLRKSFSDKS